MSLLRINCDCSSLPNYTPSAPSPKYSCEPACDEQTLQRTPSLNRPPPTGTYTKKSGKVTVTLFEQEDDAEIPTYGRRGFVTGAVHLENHDLVSRVVLKIEGKLESTSSEGGSKSIKLLNDTHTLWNGESSCPTLIPFSLSLPSSYCDGDSEFPLPPSFVSRCSTSPVLFVMSRYSINVYIERTRQRKIDFFKKDKHIKIPFNYHPRVRAHRPIVPCPSFFSTVKTSPEEWFQVSSVVKARPGCHLDPVHAHLFVPGARVYGLTDKIPFHIQLSGPLSSIQQYLMLSKHDRSSCHSETSLNIKAHILRLVVVDTRGQKASRSSVLAEGRLRAVPPLACAPCEPRNIINVDWEGEVTADGVSVGGFSASNVSVKDFIVLEMEPPPSREAHPFPALRMTVPVRLVTDSYVEETDYYQ